VSSSIALQICCLLAPSQLLAINSINQFLPSDRYNVTVVTSVAELSAILAQQRYAQDCLLVWEETNTLETQLQTQLQDIGQNLGICLPTVVIATAQDREPIKPQVDILYPHTGVVSLRSDALSELPKAIEMAIATFLSVKPSETVNNQAFPHLAAEQQRLSTKLQERLGYLGVFYKRDPKQFYRRMDNEDKISYIQRLQELYRSILLEYFKDNSGSLNKLIDEFVGLCFFADISVSQVLEIHMELIDDFAKRLKLEGRNEEILLDYRITLIDIIAHLCEMYRRSIPREA